MHVKRSAAGVGWNVGYALLGDVGILAAGSVTAVLTARWMGPEGRGQYAVATTLIAVAGTVCLIGTALAAPTFIARGLLSAERLLRFSLILAAVACCIVLGLHSIFDAGYLGLRPTPYQGAVIALAVAGVMMSSMQSGAAIGVGVLSSRAINGTVTAAVTAVGLAIVLPMTEPQWQVVTAISTWAIGQWVGDIIGWVLVWRARWPTVRGAVRVGEFFRFAGTLFPGALIGQLGFRIDVVLLAFFADSGQAGVYSIAVLAGSIVSLLSAAVSQAVVHPFGSMQRDEANALLRRAAIGSVVASALAGLLTWLVAYFASVWLLGSGFALVPTLFAIMLPGVVLFAPVRILVSYANTVLLKPSLSTTVAVIWTTCDLLLLLWLAPIYGALGAALASSVSYGVGAAAMVGLVWRRAVAERSGDTR